MCGKCYTGICRRCKNRSIEKDKTLCRPCLDQQSKYHRDRRKSDICNKCGTPKETNKGLCNKCLSKDVTRKMIQYQKWVDGELCVKCGKKRPEQSDKDQCNKCLNDRKLRNIKLKKEIINTYGGQCKCCNESHINFLNIDHVNDDGSNHRKEVGKGNVYVDLKNRDFPEGYQVLCSNCNYGKRINRGICPKHLNLLSEQERPYTPPRCLSEYKRKIRRRVACLLVYGGACVCCGEEEINFLCIDHVNDDGYKHRKFTSNIYAWLVKNNFPYGFQTLCMNCNLAKFIGKGTCTKHNKDLTIDIRKQNNERGKELLKLLNTK